MATDTSSSDGRKRRVRKPRSTVGDAHTSKRSEAMRLRYEDPRQIENARRLMLYRRWKNPELYGRKLGQWDGYTAEECARINAEAKAYATRIIEKMKENGTITPEDDPRAVEALKTAVEVMRTGANQGTKLSAAKLILEYTKSKPVAKSEVTVNKAEEWLASIAEDDGSDEDAVSANDAETPT